MLQHLFLERGDHDKLLGERHARVKRLAGNVQDSGQGIAIVDALVKALPVPGTQGRFARTAGQKGQSIGLAEGERLQIAFSWIHPRVSLVIGLPSVTRRGGPMAHPF